MGDFLKLFNEQKQELNCSNVIPIIKYLEDNLGKEKSSRIIESLGLPISFLLTKNNWVSYDYYVKLLHRMVEETGDEKAPFKACYSINSQSLFDYIAFQSYTNALFIGSPKMIYKVGFDFKFYRRWTKIGDFEIISSTNESIVLKLTLKEGYKQDKYNCLTIQGYIASTPEVIGLPPAELEHTHCACDGYDECIYTIRWKNKKKFISLFNLLVIGGILLSEYFFLNKFLDFRISFPITILFIFNVFFMKQSYDNWKQIKLNERINENQNKTLLQIMEKREQDYSEILETKTKLEEKTTYLSIFNEINEKITEDTKFNSLILNIGSILVRRLNFIIGSFFQFNPKLDKFKCQFNIFGEKSKNIEYQYFNFSNISFTVEEFELIKKEGYFSEISKLKEKDLSNELKVWFQNKDDKLFCIVPIEVSDIYVSFLCFVSEDIKIISKNLLESLLKNISIQLKIGLQKIASRTTIENVLSSLPSSVLIFNANNFEVKYVNNIFLKSFPKINKSEQKESIISKNLFDVIPFEKEDKHKFIENYRKHKHRESYETNLGNIVIEYSFFSIPQYKESEKLVGLVLNDVTEAKYFQQKLMINEKLIALGRVATGIAHEINNPLYAVLANAEELASAVIDEHNKQYANEIIDHVLNISNIIKDLSSYSKTLRNENIDHFDINYIIEESLKIVKYGLNYSSVEIVKIFGNIPKIKGTKGELEQVFINLINNAIQAMPGGIGKLTITTEVSNNVIIVTISDTGVGIPEEIISHIFDLYFTTKKEGDGTGQGLHIVKKILLKYNGRIEVNSVVNRGTTFKIYFNC
ncbi:MAG: hypothetical protein A2086_01445 [Spirochaetes bacterium GWD1_27_9]|nr:MAG: hypothetical protein A2Z98_01825 [Spirochaetes bacterium GWB1_27_13]OHD24413.1 MAG: hypothetical protein A2Y34_04180 [Spirochaetes bacterium GWC1_27_15]OHD36940.1 MAG: hypothetical protein A2086_01445 [Spirochaetes bacterium GWD1_27_9]